MGEFERVRGEPRAIQAARAGSRPKHDAHELIKLQRLAGNSAVSSLIAQREGEAEVKTDTGGGGGQQLTTYGAVLGKKGVINFKMQNGTVTDANAQIS